MNYEIMMNTLEGQKNDLEEQKNNVETTIDDCNNSLSSSMSHPEISKLYKKLEETTNQLKNGYEKSSTWFGDYLTDLTQLESSLAGFSCDGINSPEDFPDSFKDIFKKVLIPTLQSEDHENDNLSLGKIGESFSENGQKIVDASASVPSTGLGYCASWVSQVYEAAGLGFTGGNANDMYLNWCTSSNRDELEPGMIIAVEHHPHTPAGQIYGHVGIYIGNGMVRDNVGYIRDISVDEWINTYGVNSTPKWGWLSA